MKRQKRDKLSRAHSRGYHAGVSGRSKDGCPYQSSEARSQWLGGWRDAIADRLVGATLR
jgi:ribosome modulation factor